MAPFHLSAEQLSALVDGECTPDERRASTEHLFGCPECRRTFEGFRVLDGAIRQAPLVGCETALALISARLDGEADEPEAAVAERHLEACAACRSMELEWTTIATSLATLPSGAPSATVDAAIGAITRRETRPSFRPVLLPRALVAVTAALVVLIATVSRGGAPLASLAPGGDQVIVAAAQQIVLNEATNTLYVLDTANASVDARDAVTSELKARIDVGGKPTLLALNVNTNTVFVLDSTLKTLTQIDGSKNSVVSTSSVPVDGTPTSINVAPNDGKLLVTSAATSTTTGPSGSLVVLDVNTKQIEAVHDLAVIPEITIYDPTGHFAALVSTNTTTILDESYKTIATLPGGIAAAFGKTNGRIAVLGATPGGSIVSFGGLGAPLALTLPGAPRAITALPDGGFLVLVDLNKKSHVTHVSPDGAAAGDVDLPISSGSAIAFDAATDRFMVVNGDTVVKSAVPTQVATASDSPAPGASIAPNASASPSASGPASASPSASPTASASPTTSGSPTASAPVVVAKPNPNNAFEQALSVNDELVHFTLPGGRLPVLVAKAGERLWVLDDTNRVVTIDMGGGDMFVPLQLPPAASISEWKTGRGYTYALDTAAGVLYVINARSLSYDARENVLLKPVISAAVGLDDRLWMAVAGAPYLLAFDPKTGETSSFDLGPVRVAKLTVDGLGRILYADDTRHTVGLFDPKTAILNEVPLKARGRTSSLVVDSSSTLWTSTTAGEIYEVRGGAATLVLSLRVPVTQLSLDESGRVWYVAPLPAGTIGYRFAALDQADAGSQVSGLVASLDFSALGRAWLADPRGGFFVSREQPR